MFDNGTFINFGNIVIIFTNKKKVKNKLQYHYTISYLILNTWKISKWNLVLQIQNKLDHYTETFFWVLVLWYHRYLLDVVVYYNHQLHLTFGHDIHLFKQKSSCYKYPFKSSDISDELLWEFTNLKHFVNCLVLNTVVVQFLLTGLAYVKITIKWQNKAECTIRNRTKCISIK